MEDGENEFDMHGGYRGKRKISAYMSDNDDFVVSDPDSMLNMMAMQDRPKVDQQVFAENNEIYKKIIQTIKDNLNIDDETAKIVAAYLKIQVRSSVTEKDSNKVDRAKLDAVTDIVKNKADLEKEYDKMTQDKLFEEIKENRKKREKEREERRAKFATKTAAKTDSMEDKSETSDKEAAEPPKKKRTTKKKAEESKAELSRISNATRKIASTGYLYSDEMVFSPDY